MRAARPATGAPLTSLIVLIVLAAVVFAVALLTGSSGIGLKRGLAALMGSGDEATRNVIVAVRLPRVLAAYGVGSLLALPACCCRRCSAIRSPTPTCSAYRAGLRSGRCSP